MNKINYGLVTGAAGLLGFEHCKTILESGLGLIMIDINGQKLAKKYKLLVNKYKNIEIFKIDISSEVQIKNLIVKLNRKKILSEL